MQHMNLFIEQNPPERNIPNRAIKFRKAIIEHFRVLIPHCVFCEDIENLEQMHHILVNLCPEYDPDEISLVRTIDAKIEHLKRSESVFFGWPVDLQKYVFNVRTLLDNEKGSDYRVMQYIQAVSHDTFSDHPYEILATIAELQIL